jgi:hypothetical protein
MPRSVSGPSEAAATVGGNSTRLTKASDATVLRRSARHTSISRAQPGRDDEAGQQAVQRSGKRFAGDQPTVKRSPCHKDERNAADQVQPLSRRFSHRTISSLPPRRPRGKRGTNRSPSVLRSIASMRQTCPRANVSNRGLKMDLTKAFCLILATMALAGCNRVVAHPDAAQGSYYYQKEQTARDMKQERNEREYEDSQKSQ